MKVEKIMNKIKIHSLNRQLKGLRFFLWAALHFDLLEIWWVNEILEENWKHCGWPYIDILSSFSSPALQNNVSSRCISIWFFPRVIMSCWVMVMLSSLVYYIQQNKGSLRWLLHYFTWWENMKIQNSDVNSKVILNVEVFHYFSLFFLNSARSCFIVMWISPSFYLLLTSYRKKYSLRIFLKNIQ